MGSYFKVEALRMIINAFLFCLQGLLRHMVLDFKVIHNLVIAQNTALLYKLKQKNGKAINFCCVQSCNTFACKYVNCGRF